MSAAQADELRRKLACSYLPMYASEVLRGPEEYAFKFLLGRHHLEWGDAVNDNRRLLALAARDHGKSHFYCMAYPLWMAQVRAPGKVGYIFSATDQQAKEHLDKIRKELLGGGEQGGPNPLLSSLLPLKKDSARTMVFANGSEIRARGFGTRVRGGHPFWVICDDILNDDHIWSETVRAKAVDYFLSAIEPMVVPGGQIVVVGTPFHAQDLYATLRDGGVYRELKHPAIDELGEPLWPDRYGKTALEMRKRVLGSSLRWSREYLCEPISDDSSLFPSYLFDAEGIKQPYSLGMPASHWEGLGYDVYMGVDLALSASASADWFVCFVIAVDPVTQDRWVVDLYRGKGLGYQRQVDTIVGLAKSYDAQFVFVEANQYQRVISDMVVRTSDIPIKAFYTTGRSSKQVTTQRRGMTGTYSANKNALDRGVPALRMLLENKKLRIPWDASTRDKVSVWISEMQAFGFAQGKLQGVGLHDDTVMAFWMADQAARVGGSFSADFGEDLAASVTAKDTPEWIKSLGFKDDNSNGDSKPDEPEMDWFGQNQFGVGMSGILPGGLN
jgi:hypothetical protein